MAQIFAVPSSAEVFGHVLVGILFGGLLAKAPQRNSKVEAMGRSPLTHHWNCPFKEPYEG